MGPNLMHAGLGAVLDVLLDDSTPQKNTALLTAWHERMSFLADALEWPDAETMQRVYQGGASLFVHAPIDQLMTATEAASRHGCSPSRSSMELAIRPTLPRSPACWHSPTPNQPARGGSRRKLLELWNEAQRLGLNLTFDETSAFVGTGAGAKGWPLDALPVVEEIDWLSVRDIPIVLVTGSNGKTTVVRMVAAMAKAAGHIVGYTCTDGVWIGDTQWRAATGQAPPVRAACCRIRQCHLGRARDRTRRHPAPRSRRAARIRRRHRHTLARSLRRLRHHRPRHSRRSQTCRRSRCRRNRHSRLQL